MADLVSIEELKTYQFRGYVVQLTDRKLLIPSVKISKQFSEQSRLIKLQRRSLEFQLPLPVEQLVSYGLSDFRKILISLEGDKEKGKAKADEWLVELFNADVGAEFYTQQVLRSKYLKPYKNIILEALLAYFSGFKNIPTMSLFPVFEGSLRALQVDLGNGKNNNVKKVEFVKGFKGLIKKRLKTPMSHYDFSPLDYLANDEDLLMFAGLFDIKYDLILCLKLFFEEILYKKSEGCNQGFNRHLIIHMLKNDFSGQSNFVRMLILLSYIVYIEDFVNQIELLVDVVEYDTCYCERLSYVFKHGLCMADF